jgi:hypothetical protein
MPVVLLGAPEEGAMQRGGLTASELRKEQIRVNCHKSRRGDVQLRDFSESRNNVEVSELRQ